MSLENKRLLFSLAHPDDESFGFAGTLARYTQAGVETHLICATNGDVGTIDEEYMEGFNSIAERRIYELECAVEVLGLTLHLFDYRDSGMAGTPDNDHPNSLVSQDMEEVTRRVTQVIREVRPHVVATFDPLGGYMHPDHIAIHKATVLAFEAAGDATRFPEQLEAGLSLYQSQKLYFGTFDRRLMRFMLRFAPLFGIDPTRMGRNKDMNFKQIADVEWDVHAVVKVGKYTETIRRAWDCHASQQFTGGGILQWAVRRTLAGNDTYTRAHPPVNGGLRESDLFEDVKLEEDGGA